MTQVTATTKIEAQRNGMRAALDIYRNAFCTFDEPEMSVEYLKALRRELGRLLREDK